MEAQAAAALQAERRAAAAMAVARLAARLPCSGLDARELTGG